MALPLGFEQQFSTLSTDKDVRHEQLVDLFGQFVFWLRNWSLRSSRNLVESEEERAKLGTIRRKYYDSVANKSPMEREEAMLFAEETINTFLERMLWSLGDEGTDARLGGAHAYRFRIEMEIVDLETEKVVHTEAINRGGRFFGGYWGRWLNRYRNR